MEAVSTKTETTSDFQRDWIECQKNLKNPKERATGNYGNYANLEQILKECLPVVNEYNFSLRHAFDKQDGQLWCHCILTHSSGQEIRTSLPIVENLANMQKLGAAITYARRYTVCMMLGIEGEKDLDDPSHGKSDTPPDHGQKTSANGPTIDSSKKDLSDLDVGVWHPCTVSKTKESTAKSGKKMWWLTLVEGTSGRVIEVSMFESPEAYLLRKFIRKSDEETIGLKAEFFFSRNGKYLNLQDVRRIEEDTLDDISF